MKHAIINKRYYSDKGSSKKFHGAASFVLSSRLFILPDGNVTICEQLYWNSHFIIGDVQRTNLKDIWQSQEALYLCNLSRQDIGQHNKCQACTHFEECFRYGNRCWNNITKAYGKKYWDYPDPRCILAPKKTNRLDHAQRVRYGKSDEGRAPMRGLYAGALLAISGPHGEGEPGVLCHTFRHHRGRGLRRHQGHLSADRAVCRPQGGCSLGRHEAETGAELRPGPQS